MPSAEIGNVGALLTWTDYTGMMAAYGIETKALASEGADLKTTFHLEPDAAQLEFLQETIDRLGAEFRELVADGRGTLDPEVWRAGWYSGNRAVELGLADRLGRFQDAVDLARSF
jgi:protease-4